MSTPLDSRSLARPAAGISRRRFLYGVGSATFAAAFLAACSDGEDERGGLTTTANAATSADGSPSTATSTTTATPDDSASSFPVTIEHKFGSVTIPAEPQRVVTLGFSEQDPVLALGVTPVAVREWFGEQPYATWPWAQDELGDGTPEVLTMTFGELDFEAIAALNPDLIVATHSGITDIEYATLEAIAPTLAQPAEYPDFGVPWEEQTRLIGRALGREEHAAELVADVQEQIAAAAAAHPEFNAATVAWVNIAETAGQFYVTGPDTPPIRFLKQLGFRMSDELASAIGDSSSLQISTEQLGLIDADAVIVQTISGDGRDALEANPIFEQLRASREGRAIVFTTTAHPAYAALSFSTVLSLPFAVEALTPALSAAVDGDPATPVEVTP
mgnify:CR=1 FL=1